MQGRRGGAYVPFAPVIAVKQVEMLGKPIFLPMKTEYVMVVEQHGLRLIYKSTPASTFGLYFMLWLWSRMALGLYTRVLLLLLLACISCYGCGAGWP